MHQLAAPETSSAGRLVLNYIKECLKKNQANQNTYIARNCRFADGDKIFNIKLLCLPA